MKPTLPLFYVLMFLSLRGAGQIMTPIDSIDYAYNSLDSTLDGYIGGWFHVYGEIDSLVTDSYSADSLTVRMYYTACDPFQMFYPYDTAFTLKPGYLGEKAFITTYAVLNDPDCTGSSGAIQVDTTYYSLDPSFDLTEHVSSSVYVYTTASRLVVAGLNSEEIEQVQICDLSGRCFSPVHFGNHQFALPPQKTGVWIVRITTKRGIISRKIWLE